MTTVIFVLRDFNTKSYCGGETHKIKLSNRRHQAFFDVDVLPITLFFFGMRCLCNEKLIQSYKIQNDYIFRCPLCSNLKPVIFSSVNGKIVIFRIFISLIYRYKYNCNLQLHTYEKS